MKTDIIVNGQYFITTDKHPRQVVSEMKNFKTSWAKIDKDTYEVYADIPSAEKEPVKSK